ncbi:MAG: haloacid dehalogenase type II [Caldilineaceae bacterium SB0662_bin_9]|uniref:Haloacid dehalogenase type II n=1 Tax=Caldilineaceae bacterium SB0662_bin_9 TaxID=2605258 RepID=A0A6B1DQU1_9CHLR|nr:haloacid dehalogenase type II [Caldilineaceae bacterium SB0662_bin_9]
MKALVFDVFGTLVDWHTGVRQAGELAGRSVGSERDWSQFALDWRAGYGPAMAAVNDGRASWQTIDGIHRAILDGLLAGYGLETLTEANKQELNKVWHRLPAWPDVGEGLDLLRRNYLLAPLSNGNVSLLIGLARTNGWQWDCVLSSELAGKYKPDPSVYRTAARLLDLNSSEIMMVAAHAGDLRAAAATGMATGWIHRPLEFGPVAPPSKFHEVSQTIDADLVAPDLTTLSRKLADVNKGNSAGT